MASTRDEIFRFLQRIVGDTLTPEGSKLLVWTAPAKESRWYADLWQAADEASRLSGNVYFGVCLAPDDVCGGKTRATAQQVSYATCLWADIDYVSPHHAKGNLPPSEADAMNCLREAFPPHLQPPVVINSGGGLQAFWPLAEPLDITSDIDRAGFAVIVRGWQGLLRATMERHGWTLDSTHDLARVMRLAGTENANAGGKPVSLLNDAESRFELDQFRELVDVVVDAETVRAVCVPAQERYASSVPGLAGVIPREGHTAREPLASKIAALCDLSEAFAASWHNLNPSLKDDSRSSYDASLVTAMAHWMDDTDDGLAFTAQDMADVIVDHRMKHGTKAKDFKKAGRLDYIQTTIARCVRLALESKRESVPEGSGAHAPEHSDSPLPSVPFGKAGVPEPSFDDPAEPQEPRPIPPPAGDMSIPEFSEAQQSALKPIEERLGMRILRGCVYENTEPCPEVWLAVVPFAPGGKQGTVVLSTTDMLSISKVTEAFFGATYDYPVCFGGAEPLKKEGWKLYARDMVRVLPKLMKPEETTETGALRIYLRKYLASTPITKSLEDARMQDAPFTVNGRVYVNITAFSNFVRISSGGELGGVIKLAKLMCRAGFRKVVMPFKTEDGKMSSLNGYLMPPELVSAAQDEPQLDAFNVPGGMEDSVGAEVIH